MADLTTAEFEAAVSSGNERLRGPRAESAHYDVERDRVVIRLTSGLEIGFAPGSAEGLDGASLADLSEIVVEPFGLAIHFPRLDADLYSPALLDGFLGSRTWMASRLGAAGGKVRSAAKTASARDNGRRGGRPKKSGATST